MVEFAVHHELKHRFAIHPSGSEFSKLYGVRGIPQAVVIDREGKIRMIKVGSGSKNSDAIDESRRNHHVANPLLKTVGEPSPRSCRFTDGWVVLRR